MKGASNLPPASKVYPTRENTITAKMIDLLARPEGATIEELQAVCVRRDGQPWSRSSVVGALYYDLNKKKGFGTETRDGRLHLVLPLGQVVPPHNPNLTRIKHLKSL